jgi:hypothetical protein
MEAVTTLCEIRVVLYDITTDKDRQHKHSIRTDKNRQHSSQKGQVKQHEGNDTDSCTHNEKGCAHNSTKYKNCPSSSFSSSSLKPNWHFY